MVPSVLKMKRRVRFEGGERRSLCEEESVVVPCSAAGDWLLLPLSSGQLRQGAEERRVWVLGTGNGVGRHVCWERVIWSACPVNETMVFRE